MNIYKYLYYKIYVFTNKLGNYDVPFSALLGMSFLLMINSLIIVLRIIFQDRISDFNTVKPFFIIIGVFILLLNYFLFIYKRKYREIIKKYKKESEKSRKIGNSIVIIYVIISLASIFF